MAVVSCIKLVSKENFSLLSIVSLMVADVTYSEQFAMIAKRSILKEQRDSTTGKVIASYAANQG